MHRQLPIAISHDPDDDDSQRAIINSAFSFSVLMITIAGIGIMIFGPSVSDSIPRSVYFLVGIAVVARQLSVLSDQLATSVGRYGLSGLTNVTTSVVGLILGVVGMLAFGVDGLLLSQICWAMLGFLMISRSLKVNIRPQIDLDVLRALIATGIATIGNGLIFLGFKSLDRVAILAFLGTVSLGYYGLALAAASLIEMTFQPIGRVTLQRSAAVHAQSETLLPVWRRVAAILIGQMTVFSMLAGVMVLWLPVVVHFVLPEYGPGQTATSILVFGVVAFSLRSTLVYFHLATGRLIRTYPLQIALLIAGAVAVWATMTLSPGLTAVATTVSIVFAIVSLVFAVYSLRLIDTSLRFILKNVITIILPAAYTSIETFGLLQLTPRFDLVSGSLGLVLSSIILTVVFLVLQLPVLLFAEQKTGLLSELAALAMTYYRRFRSQTMDQQLTELSS